MLNVKRLITGFLILAVGAGTSAWILSNVPSAPQNTASGAAAPSATLPRNAFLSTNTTPQDVQNLLAGGLSPSAEAALNNPNNLTGAIGNSLLDGLVVANPSGITTDSSGNNQINAPDDNTMLAELSQSPSARSVSVPNWSAEAARDQAAIKILKKPSEQDVLDYWGSFNDINEKYFEQTGLIQLAIDASSTSGATPILDPSTITNAMPQISGALADALRMNVPGSYATFQKSWIKLLVYEKNVALAFKDVSTDPARSMLALDNEQNNYDEALQDFENVAQETLPPYRGNVSIKNDPPKTNGIIAFLDSIFPFASIQPAHAQVSAGSCVAIAAAAKAAAAAAKAATAGVAAEAAVPVKNILTDPGVLSLQILAAGQLATQAAHCTSDSTDKWVQFFLGLAKNMALQILKNTLLAQLQSRVLKWIQGAGAPRFVTDAATTMFNAAMISATNVINSNFACINTATMPKIQVILNALYKPGNNICAAQFQSQLSASNLTNFFNNFSNGGFISFGTMLTPSNNFYGALFFTAQNAGQAVQQSNSLFVMKTTANQGFNGSQQCADGSNPDGTHLVCSNGQSPGNGVCPGGLPAYPIPNGGKCASGQNPQVTMPGIVNKDMLGDGVTLGSKTILSANDIAGIINGFVGSLLMGIVNAAVTSASNSINGAINGSSGGLLSVNPTSIAASGGAPALSCTPATTTLSTVGLQATLYATGGTPDASGNPPTYTWQSSDGQTGSGTAFIPIYEATGAFTVTVSDNASDTPATCSVIVTPPGGATTPTTPGGVTCAPQNQILSMDPSGSSLITFSAQGGATSTNGSSPSYAWSAIGASGSSGGQNPGDPFTATYNASGTYTASVTDLIDGSSATCSVTLQ